MSADETDATSTLASEARRATTLLGAKFLTTRILVRAPIVLYRSGLGFLFGNRLLMLEHRGRTTGARRFVVLEVVERPGPDSFVVVSGFGTRAQWYRNVMASPDVGVSCGWRLSRRAVAAPLSDDESAAALRRYAAAHPRAWRNLKATIEAATGRTVDTMPMVELRLR